MPEGDTLHRTARRLARALGGKRIARVVGSVHAVVRAGLEGRRVERVEARGKNLAIAFDDGRVLHSHMRMNGSWHVYRAGERWWLPEHDARVALEVEPAGGDPAFVAVCFRAPVVHLDTARAVDATLAHLGPDIVADRFDDDGAIARLRAAGDRAIGEALLDQRVLAGVGNIYKSEVLFAERVDPFAPVSALDDATLAALVRRARALMRRNVPSTGRMRTTTTGLGGDRFAVYRRGGLPCPRCGSSIVRATQGAPPRSTWLCPVCQKGATSSIARDRRDSR